MSLSEKSFTQLRGIAQVHGVKDFLSRTKEQLIQDIEIKLGTLAPEPKIEIPKPEYDPRIMTKIPARKSDQALVEELLKPYTDRGLRLTFPEPEIWSIAYDKRNDTGSMRIPLRVIMQCADKVLNG